MTRTALLVGVLLLSPALRVAAQQQQQHPAEVPPVVGTWRGTSTCTVRPSACNNEVVVYRITPTTRLDSLNIDARKIVNGQEEEMGVIGCHLGATSSQVICTMPNGVWNFTVRGDSLTGDLRLRDNTRYRDVRTTRSR